MKTFGLLFRCQLEERFSFSVSLICFRVGIDLPTIEVRFENLNVGAETYVGARAMPTILNFTLDLFQVTIYKL